VRASFGALFLWWSIAGGQEVPADGCGELFGYAGAQHGVAVVGFVFLLPVGALWEEGGDVFAPEVELAEVVSWGAEVSLCPKDIFEDEWCVCLGCEFFAGVNDGEVRAVTW